METVYTKLYVKLHAYDGRILDGFIYVNSSHHVKEDLPPSKRYMKLLIRGAAVLILVFTSRTYKHEFSSRSHRSWSERLLRRTSEGPPNVRRERSGVGAEEEEEEAGRVSRDHAGATQISHERKSSLVIYS